MQYAEHLIEPVRNAKGCVFQTPMKTRLDTSAGWRLVVGCGSRNNPAAGRIQLASAVFRRSETSPLVFHFFLAARRMREQPDCVRKLVTRRAFFHVGLAGEKSFSCRVTAADMDCVLRPKTMSVPRLQTTWPQQRLSERTALLRGSLRATLSGKAFARCSANTGWNESQAGNPKQSVQQVRLGQSILRPSQNRSGAGIRFGKCQGALSELPSLGAFRALVSVSCFLFLLGLSRPAPVCVGSVPYL